VHLLQDFFLLGCTTFVAGVIGLPAPNGLVPQAPVHTESLCVTKMVPKSTPLSAGGFFEGNVSKAKEKADKDEGMKVVRTRLVEQRISHFAMGLLIMGCMSRPLLVVLYVPRFPLLSTRALRIDDFSICTQRLDVSCDVCGDLHRCRMGISRGKRNRSQDTLRPSRLEPHSLRPSSEGDQEVKHSQIHRSSMAFLCRDYRHLGNYR